MVSSTSSGFSARWTSFRRISPVEWARIASAFTANSQRAGAGRRGRTGGLIQRNCTAGHPFRGLQGSQEVEDCPASGHCANLLKFPMPLAPSLLFRFSRPEIARSCFWGESIRPFIPIVMKVLVLLSHRSRFTTSSGPMLDRFFELSDVLGIATSSRAFRRYNCTRRSRTYKSNA